MCWLMMMLRVLLSELSNVVFVSLIMPYNKRNTYSCESRNYLEVLGEHEEVKEGLNN